MRSVSALLGYLLVCCFSLAWSSGLLALSEAFSPCCCSVEPSARFWTEEGGGSGGLVMITCGPCFMGGLKRYKVHSEVLQYFLGLHFCLPFYGVPPATWNFFLVLSVALFFHACIFPLPFCFSVLASPAWCCNCSTFHPKNVAFLLTASFLCEDVKISLWLAMSASYWFNVKEQKKEQT